MSTLSVSTRPMSVSVCHYRLIFLSRGPRPGGVSVIMNIILCFSLHVMIWHVSSSLANFPFDVSDSSLHDLKNETLIMVHDGSGGILSMGGMQGGRSRRGELTRSAPMFCLCGDGGATSNHDWVRGRGGRKSIERRNKSMVGKTKLDRG